MKLRLLDPPTSSVATKVLALLKDRPTVSRSCSAVSSVALWGLLAPLTVFVDSKRTPPPDAAVAAISVLSVAGARLRAGKRSARGHSTRSQHTAKAHGQSTRSEHTVRAQHPPFLAGAVGAIADGVAGSLVVCCTGEVGGGRAGEEAAVEARHGDRLDPGVRVGIKVEKVEQERGGSDPRRNVGCAAARGHKGEPEVDSAWGEWLVWVEGTRERRRARIM